MSGYVAFCVGFVIIYYIIGLFLDPEYNQPTDFGTPKSQYMGGYGEELDMSQAALFMNIDE